jgi:methionyl-tRNA formyltransferase
MNQPKICVFAYNSLGFHCLQALLDSQIFIDCLWTYEDRLEGLPHCADLNIPQIFFDNPNDHIDFFQKESFDVMFSFYYRHILKRDILNTCPQAFNVHGSLLPKYRGRCPVNWAILNGETVTGVTLHRMVEKIDAGDIVCQKSVSIKETDFAGDVQDRLDKAAYDILIENSHDIINGRISSIPQSLAEGSYFGGRNPEDGRIDLTQSHKKIFNLVRAVLPYPRFPGAFFGDNHIIDVSLTPVNSIKGWIKIYGCDGIPVFCKCLNG